MDTHQVPHMNDGNGETSYANNSKLQKTVMFTAKPILEESIMRLYSILHPCCLKVADLGCSTGPNALQVIYDIANVVDRTTCNLALKLPSFQFFLNDLFGNDFNTLFQSLSQFLRILEEEKAHKFGPCFVNATPGTFYKRLFPNNFLHFVHSSYSLHWLSQAPKELVNKENIHLTSTSPPAVHRAYLEQFQKDFKLFLTLRSQELVPGGGMFLTLLGREKTRSMRQAWELISTILNEMVLENLTEAVKLESFNLPLYDSTIEEVKEVIEEEGSFTLLRLESVTLAWDANINEDVSDDDNNKLDPNMRAEFIAKYHRAALEPLLKAQFGEEAMDKLFLRFTNKVVQLLMEVEILEISTLIISLIKNA